MTIHVCLRRFAGVAAVFAAALMGVQDIAAQEFEEIVVTARKRDESVLEIPLSVSAYTQDDLDALGMNTIEQLSTVTTGFEFQNIGPGGTGGRHNPNIRFRGLSVQQGSPASRAGAVFWNGGYISDGAGILPLIDLERVEVLKGPQTAFFGRNTFAGAVNYIPATPGEEFSGKASLSWSASDETSYNFTAAIGGPLSENLGVRVALMQQKVGADYQFDNGDPLGEQNNTAITGLLTFQVSEAASFQVSGFYVDSDDTMALQSQDAPVAAGSCNRTYSGNIRGVGSGANAGSFSTDLSQSIRNLFCGSVPDWDAVQPNLSEAGVITASTPLFGFSNPWSFVQNLPPELEGYGIVEAPDSLGNTYELWRVDLSGEYELANESVVSAQFARGESTSWRIWDNNFGTPTLFVFPNPGSPWLSGQASWVRDTYAEVRYTPPAAERLNYVVGASYYSQDNRLTDFSSFGATNNLQFQDGDNFGVFGSVEYQLTGQWTVSLEGRWNRDTQTILYDGISIAQGIDPAPLENLEQQYSAFMPRLILSWQPSENTNFYGHFSNSNLQGIFTNAADYSQATMVEVPLGTFTPKQTLSAFEIGVKQRVSGWLSYAVALYFMDWENQTFFELSPAPLFVAANLAGDSETRGIEVEFELSPSDWFNFSGGFTYNDVEFTDFAGTGSVATAVLAPPPTLAIGQQISSVGGRPRYIPEWTGSLSAVLQLDQLTGMARDIWLRVDGIYQGQFYIDNFNWNSVDGYWKINARLHADIGENFSVELYGNNLTNDLSYTTAGGTTSIFGLPHRKTFAPLPVKREVGLRLVANF
ncbi:MAG: TonB-dependent receptor [Gammaproteobacteria bacterium]|nr:TonB-dependent receptor [Gammaproteobacteria bacterium]MYD01983.1 TonB-dependent receptor [Gammaproteobacteria bacterium]MYI26448.1 TonB-dependent receptor [Gammaproteobacteria bacterium]